MLRFALAGSRALSNVLPVITESNRLCTREEPDPALRAEIVRATAAIPLEKRNDERLALVRHTAFRLAYHGQRIRVAFAPKHVRECTVGQYFAREESDFVRQATGLLGNCDALNALRIHIQNDAVALFVDAEPVAALRAWLTQNVSLA